MLDMFSDVPLNDLESRADDRLSEKYPYYDISAIDKEEYLWSQRSNPDIKMHWGGIRKQVFGTINGLTKSPLVLMDGKVRPFITWHHPKGARMADISCLLTALSFRQFVLPLRWKMRRDRQIWFKVDDEYKAYAKGDWRDNTRRVRSRLKGRAADRPQFVVSRKPAWVRRMQRTMFSLSPSERQALPTGVG